MKANQITRKQMEMNSRQASYNLRAKTNKEVADEVKRLTVVHQTEVSGSPNNPTDNYSSFKHLTNKLVSFLWTIEPHTSARFSLRSNVKNHLTPQWIT